MKYAHQTVYQRRAIIIREWAEYFGVSRQTIKKHIMLFNENNPEYNPRDIFSILNFCRYFTEVLTSYDG